MRIKVSGALAAAFALCCSLQAQINTETLLDFPARTESVEYDNLATLRALPNYEALRRRFSGKPLERLKAALTAINLPESAVDAIAIGTSPNEFYGLISGSFNGVTITKNAIRKGCAFVGLEDHKILSPAGEVSILFLSDSLAAFGTPVQIKAMFDARRGVAPRIGANSNLVYLLNQTEREAPVRGISSGSQIAASLADAMRGESSLNIDWTRVASNVSAFGYGVKLDSKAHVTATLQCKSPATAVILRQMLGALSALQSVAAYSAKAGAAAPFENLEVSSSGIFIGLRMDTPLPTP